MFYISTAGGSASVWVATALSLHPRILCFHGISDRWTGGLAPEPDPETFAKRLLYFYEASYYTKLLGGIHGFGGISAKRAFEERDGAFLGLLRHPIMRLNSMWHPYPGMYGAAAAEVLANQPGQSNLSSALDFDTATGALEFSPVVKSFATICHGTLVNDLALIDKLGRESLFRYEDVTIRKDVFADMFERLVTPFLRARGLTLELKVEPTPDYLDAVFAMGRRNVRSGTAANPAQTYESWPEALQLILIAALRAFGGARIIDTYAAFGYELPEPLRRAAARALPRRAVMLPPPSGPVRLQYRSSGPVSALIKREPESSDAGGGASFLGYNFYPRRDHGSVRIRVTANAYATEENEVGLVVFAGRDAKPAYCDVKPVMADQWVGFDHTFTVHDVTRAAGLPIDVRIGVTRPSTILVNGPDGVPPEEVGYPMLVVQDVEADGEPGLTQMPEP